MKREACGTPNYTPPEVVIGQGYTTSADLWSFGVILYRMKYGVCPFEMPELRDTLKKIKEGSFIIPRWNSASPEIVDLIHKLLVVDAEARLTISQVLDHPFFKKSEEEISKGGGLRNLMQRLFSTEKGDRSTDKRRMDSCESKKDIKNILK
jgi:serine/threonine protein kinase